MVEKLCMICPVDDGYCHCGNCEECDYISTEKELNMHIMNHHESKDVFDNFGRDWIRAPSHYIQGSLELYNK